MYDCFTRFHSKNIMNDNAESDLDINGVIIAKYHAVFNSEISCFVSLPSFILKFSLIIDTA